MTYYFCTLKTKLLAIFILLFTYFSAIASGISSGPKPQWVVSINTDLSAKVPSSEIESGYYYLLNEKQVNVQSSAFYYHYVKKITNQSGVENSSQLEFNYDKAFETLVIHEVKIIRDNKVIDQIDLSKLKVVQKTKGMEQLQYSETMSGLLFLGDVKTNDIIEYSYTVTQRNPLFSKKYSDNFLLQFSVPMCSVVYRILIPADRKLYMKELNSNIKPIVKEE